MSGGIHSIADWAGCLAQVEKAPLESYADVGGLEQQIVEIKEAVELPLTHPELYEDIGIKPPKVPSALPLLYTRVPLSTSGWSLSACRLLYAHFLPKTGSSTTWYPLCLHTLLPWQAFAVTYLLSESCSLADAPRPGRCSPAPVAPCQLQVLASICQAWMHQPRSRTLTGTGRRRQFSDSCLQGMILHGHPGTG